MFRPLVTGAHAQTLGGQLVRSFLRWPFASEDVVVDADDDVQILVRASWQPGEVDGGRSHRPALLLIHGLEGSDEARYVVSTGVHAYRAGWHVVRMNMRGCGDSLALCPRLYNAGLTADLAAVAEWLAGRVRRFAMVGFSLGAGLALLTLGREKHRLPDELAAAVAVCPPLDMSRSADALEERANWIYQRKFTRSLCRSYQKRQRLASSRYHAGRERGVTTLREFDDVITAFYGGYHGAEHYYRSVSSGPALTSIDRPTLVLASDNDPFIPRDSIAHWAHTDDVRLELISGAGHVGFVGTSRAPRFFWAADYMLAYFREIDALSTAVTGS